MVCEQRGAGVPAEAEVTKEEARKWWEAGFWASGEGWNGEWPFGADLTPERRARAEKSLDEDFEKDWEAITAAEKLDPNDPTLVPWE